MHTNSVRLFANVNRSQINITDTHYEIKGIPITVDDAVMNGIHYDATNNSKGIPSIKGQPVTLSHPFVNGNNVSGKEGAGLENYFSGTTVNGSVYNTNGVWYVDASINKKKLLAQDDGERYADAFDNKADIGVSTGLTFDYNEESGVNSKGDKYTKKAINQKYDHLAILLDEAPAGGDATVMRFNCKDKSHINVNELIDSNSESKELGALTKIMQMLNSLVKSNSGNKPFNLNDNGVHKMQLLINELNAANIKTEGLDDAGILSAYNAMKGEESKGKKPKQTPEEIEAEKKKKEAKDKAANSDLDSKIANAVNAAIKPLMDQLQANSDDKLRPAREAVMNHFSMDESEVKALPETALNKLLAQTKGFATLQANQFQANSGKSELDGYLPE